MPGTPAQFWGNFRLVSGLCGCAHRRSLPIGMANKEVIRERGIPNSHCALHQWQHDRSRCGALDRDIRKKPGVLRRGIPRRRWKVGIRRLMVPLSRRSPSRRSHRSRVRHAPDSRDPGENRAAPRCERSSPREDAGSTTECRRGSATLLDQRDVTTTWRCVQDQSDHRLRRCSDLCRRSTCRVA
jgi:hypothetical protein